MSQQTAPRPSSTPEEGHWQTQYLIAVGSILLVGILTAFILAHRPAEPPPESTRDEEQLHQAIAHLNQTDPNWKWADLQAHREPPPNDLQNPAPYVIKAYSQLETVANQLTVSSEKARAGLRDGTIKDRKHAGLEPAADAIQTARSVRNYGRGQYAVVWNDKNPLMTALPHKTAVIGLVDLLTIDAEMRAHEGKVDEALESIQTALVIVRAIGDEPMLATQFQRTGFSTLCTRALEESLRLGQTESDNLKSVQLALFVEADQQPWLKFGARGERAGLDGLMTALEHGVMPRADRFLLDTRADGVSLILVASKPEPVARFHTIILDYSTQFIQALELPVKEQQARLKELANSLTDAPREVQALLSAFRADLVEASLNGQTALRCAAVGMALERYRKSHENKWPDTLEELVEAKLLSKVPIDPFDGEKPLRYQRTKEGVVVYSAGPDGKTETRSFERRSDADTSFRLWNVDTRHR